jgi:hypothetical protein
MADDVVEEVVDAVLQILEEPLHCGFVRIVDKSIEGHDQDFGEVAALVLFGDVHEVLVESLLANSWTGRHWLQFSGSFSVYKRLKVN